MIIIVKEDFIEGVLGTQVVEEIPSDIKNFGMYTDRILIFKYGDDKVTLLESEGSKESVSDSKAVFMEGYVADVHNNYACLYDYEGNKTTVHSNGDKEASKNFNGEVYSFFFYDTLSKDFDKDFIVDYLRKAFRAFDPKELMSLDCKIYWKGELAQEVPNTKPASVLVVEGDSASWTDFEYSARKINKPDEVEIFHDINKIQIKKKVASPDILSYVVEGKVINYFISKNKVVVESANIWDKVGYVILGNSIIHYKKGLEEVFPDAMFVTHAVDMVFNKDLSQVHKVIYDERERLRYYESPERMYLNFAGMIIMKTTDLRCRKDFDSALYTIIRDIELEGYDIAYHWTTIEIEDKETEEIVFKYVAQENNLLEFSALAKALMAKRMTIEQLKATLDICKY